MTKGFENLNRCTGSSGSKIDHQAGVLEISTDPSKQQLEAFEGKSPCSALVSAISLLCTCANHYLPVDLSLFHILFFVFCVDGFLSHTGKVLTFTETVINSCTFGERLITFYLISSLRIVNSRHYIFSHSKNHGLNHLAMKHQYKWPIASYL